MAGTDPMRVMNIVSVADTQSIPFELALRLPLAEADNRIISVYDAGPFPSADLPDNHYCLNARSRFDIAAAIRLKSHIKAFQPDIVHVHQTVTAALALVGVNTARTAIIKTEHNDRRHQGRLTDVVNRLIYPRLSGVICNSRSTLETLKPFESRSAAAKAITIHNGVDPDRVTKQSERSSEICAQLGIPDGSFLVMAVGRFVEQKNFSGLVNAFALARPDLPEGAKLLLVGTGPLVRSIRAQAEASDAADSVIFAGALKRDDVYALLHRAELFAVPSLWEGFCNAAVEALVAGCPIVASDIAVLKEVLGTHATFFPLEEGAMQSALIAAAAPSQQSTDLRDARMKHGRSYSLDRAASEYLLVYDRVLRGDREH